MKLNSDTKMKQRTSSAYTKATPTIQKYTSRDLKLHVVLCSRRTNVHPQQRNDDGEQSGPHIDNGWDPSPPSHQAFGKGVKMGQNPEAEEHSSNEPAPLWKWAIQSSCNSYCNCNQVQHHYCNRRDH